MITAGTTTSWGAPPPLDANPLNPPNAEKTTVRAIHITQLRFAINALRSHLGMSNYSWITSATTSDLISADPILEMRIALDQALGTPSPSYAAGLAQHQSILAVHIQELRNRVLAAWNSNTGGTDVRWMVMDQLGTPRMIFDQTGSFSSVSRYDYLPFGEELFAGGRTSNNGYPSYNTTRQKFTGYERDDEVKLDFAQARYFSSAQGRFTGVDPISGRAVDPQSWNMYAYVVNNPVNLTDPTGMNYFMGSGANDQFIDEFRIDGFDSGPEGTASRMDETPSLASWSPNQFLNSEGIIYGGSEEEPQNAGTTEPVVCTIKVELTTIRETGGISTFFVTGYHAALITHQSDQNFSLGFRAGPTKRSASDGGVILGESGVYDQNFIDYPTSKRSPNATGRYAGTCDKYIASFKETQERVNRSSIPYRTFPAARYANSNNSNSYVYTLLQRAGLDTYAYGSVLYGQAGKWSAFPGWHPLPTK